MTLKAQDVGFPARPIPLRGDETAAEVKAKVGEIDHRYKPNGAAPAEPNTNILARVAEFGQKFLILPEAAYLPFAVWIMATYFAAVFDAFPYLALTSPTKGCGKTRVLEVIELLCATALRIISPSAAALFRMMATCPTLLVDEAEIFKSKNVSEGTQAILAILNAGYRKNATVPRCEPPKNEVKFFPVFGPKAFSCIGTLPATLADRSICIAMQRRDRATQKVARFSERRTPTEAEPIRDALRKWAESQRETVRDAYDKTPDLEFLEDRDGEIWLPLFAVCAVAAPERVNELRECAIALTKSKAADDVEDSLPLKLLADVREVWPAGVEKMLTVNLLDRLRAISDSPWAESGHELTPRRLARMLHPFGIKPRQIRFQTQTAKGYLCEEIEAALSRYLPSPAKISETCETTRMNIGENDDFQSETEPFVSDRKNALKPA